MYNMMVSVVTNQPIKFFLAIGKHVSSFPLLV